MKTLISIDPGLSTGLIIGTYSDTEPLRVTHAFQIEGGVEGFLKNIRVTHGEDWNLHSYGVMHLPGMKSVELYRYEMYYHEGWDECEEDHECPEEVRSKNVTVLAEKFTARGSANAGFSYRTDALEPLRVEGAILALGIKPTWVSPQQQYFMGGDSKSEKLKNRNAWFKEHKDLGYYITGKDVGYKDADDARSALAHCISFLRREKHLPTLGLFRTEEDD